MSWQFNETEAVFIQIANRLRGEIISGKYLPGEQLPPVRKLAMDAAVNPNTMQKALAYLEDEGLLHAKGTVGRFVTDDNDVLTAAGNKMRREAVRRWLSEASSIGITADRLISYIKEEENNNE